MDMHLWYLEKWKKYVDMEKGEHKTGIYMRIDKNVDDDVTVFCKNFVRWMRKEFFFPVKVNIYVKENYRIKAKDGELVVGTFWRPEGFEQDNTPYVRIATGDYQELVAERGKKEAMWSILGTLAHELSHYFQYINQLELTRIGEERQATVYSDYILNDYDEYLSSKKVSGIS